MKNLIEVQNLCKCYEDFTLEDIHLSVPAGCIVGLIGENGAGKTTTLKAILNIIRPDQGIIRLMGLSPEDPASRLQVGTVFEDSYFHDQLSPRQVCKIMNHIFPSWDPSLFDTYCTRFNLPDRKPIGQFSRGMRMKLSLATALARHPKCLILDEATSGLDPVVRGQMLDLFLEFIQDEECGILMSSHITDDMEKICDQIAYIHTGRLIFQEEKDRLLENMAILKAPSAEIRSLPSELVISIQQNAFGAAALVRNPNKVSRLLRGVILEPASLAEIMRFYAGGDTQ